MSLIAGGLAVLMGIALFNGPLLQSTKTPDVLKQLVETAVPPRDLYDNLAEMDVDIARTGTWSLEFRNKYEGLHSLGVVMGSGDDLYYSDYAIKLKVKVEFFSGNRVLVTLPGDIEYNRFLGQRGSGFILLTYRCPTVLPIKAPLTARVTITEPDPELQSRFGSARLYVAREASH